MRRSVVSFLGTVNGMTPRMSEADLFGRHVDASGNASGSSTRAFEEAAQGHELGVS